MRAKQKKLYVVAVIPSIHLQITTLNVISQNTLNNAADIDMYARFSWIPKLGKVYIN